MLDFLHNIQPSATHSCEMGERNHAQANRVRHIKVQPMTHPDAEEFDHLPEDHVIPSRDTLTGSADPYQPPQEDLVQFSRHSSGGPQVPLPRSSAVRDSVIPPRQAHHYPGLRGAPRGTLFGNVSPRVPLDIGDTPARTALPVGGALFGTPLDLGNASAHAALDVGGASVRTTLEVDGRCGPTRRPCMPCSLSFPYWAAAGPDRQVTAGNNPTPFLRDISNHEAWHGDRQESAPKPLPVQHSANSRCIEHHNGISHALNVHHHLDNPWSSPTAAHVGEVGNATFREGPFMHDEHQERRQRSDMQFQDTQSNGHSSTSRINVCRSAEDGLSCSVNYRFQIRIPGVTPGPRSLGDPTAPTHHDQGPPLPHELPATMRHVAGPHGGSFGQSWTPDCAPREHTSNLDPAFRYPWVPGLQVPMHNCSADVIGQPCVDPYRSGPPLERARAPWIETPWQGGTCTARGPEGPAQPARPEVGCGCPGQVMTCPLHDEHVAESPRLSTRPQRGSSAMLHPVRDRGPAGVPVGSACPSRPPSARPPPRRPSLPEIAPAAEPGLCTAHEQPAPVQGHPGYRVDPQGIHQDVPLPDRPQTHRMDVSQQNLEAQGGVSREGWQGDAQPSADTCTTAVQQLPVPAVRSDALAPTT